MRGFGYVVSRNKPYAGGFITEHYGNPTGACTPSSSRSTARSTWTSGATNARSRSPRLAAEFAVLADQLAAIPLEELRPYRAAAE